MSDLLQGTEFLQRLLSATGLRGQVLAHNIANQNTPGFTRSDVRFEELLSDALGRGRSIGDIQPQVVEDVTTEARPDGNNVQLEMELGAARQNRLMAETYLTILQGHFSMLQEAISSRG